MSQVIQNVRGRTRHTDPSITELDALIAARRQALARSALRAYTKTKSLRKAARQLGVSHETLRALVKAAEREEQV